MTDATAAERRRFAGAFFDVAPAMFVGALDQTIVAAAITSVVADLGGLSHASWIVTSYLLAATVAAPIYGRLGDAYGRKSMLLWSLGLFAVGSVGCAAAPNLVSLIGFRFLQGIGGGGLMTLAQALLGEAVTPRERGRFQGWFGALFALSSTLGPFAGGILAEKLGWRSIFWINVPLAFAATVALRGIIERKGSGRFSLDLAGTSLFLIFAACLLLSLSLASSWSSALTASGFLIASTACVMLIRVESRTDDPLIPITLLRKRAVWSSTFAVLFFAGALFGFVVQFPAYLQIVLGFSPGSAGALLIPFTLAQVTASTAAGLRISATGKPHKLLSVALAFAALALATLAAGPAGHLAWAVASGIAAGAGLGVTMPIAQTVVQWAAGAEKLGAATASLSFFRSLGGVFGSAVASGVLLLVLHGAGSGTAATTGQMISFPPNDATVFAFRMTFVSLAVFAAVAAAFAWLCPDIDLAEPNVGGS